MRSSQQHKLAAMRNRNINIFMRRDQIYDHTVDSKSLERQDSNMTLLINEDGSHADKSARSRENSRVNYSLLSRGGTVGYDNRAPRNSENALLIASTQSLHGSNPRAIQSLLGQLAVDREENRSQETPVL